jgi:hypothetical protein
MERLLQRYTQLCEAQGSRFLVHNGKLFTFANPYTVAPLGPYMWDYRLPPEEAGRVLTSLRGRILLLTGGFFAGGCDQWYAVICDRFTDVPEMSSGNLRSKMRRGLKRCVVKRVEADFIARHGYEIMVEACKGYGTYQGIVPSESRFRKSAIDKQAFEDLIHYWGVFDRLTGKLVAFSENRVFGKIEVLYTTIKLHPRSLALYAGYVLIHAMNEYYLGQQRFQYVNDGWRSVLHDTDIQQFLIHNFSFRREPSSLRVFYTSGLSALMKMTYPFRGMSAKADRRVAALFALEEISRACSAKAGSAPPDATPREGPEAPAPDKPFQEQ